MPRKKQTPPEQTHDHAVAHRIGPGAYRAECQHADELWTGPLRLGRWWEARKQAEADADEHAGRAQKPLKGPTPTRPVRIPDRLWLPVVQIADEEDLSASEILRQAIEADPRVAAILAGQSALASASA